MIKFLLFLFISLAEMKVKNQYVGKLSPAEFLEAVKEKI